MSKAVNIYFKRKDGTRGVNYYTKDNYRVSDCNHNSDLFTITKPNGKHFSLSITLSVLTKLFRPNSNRPLNTK